MPHCHCRVAPAIVQAGGCFARVFVLAKGQLRTPHRAGESVVAHVCLRQCWGASRLLMRPSCCRAAPGLVPVCDCLMHGHLLEKSSI
ncbi:hypothetical protein HAX54_051837 [Datura stramonium]|uniref:Uncharacterized protein n=1 Tax=Datura stramonium TaxID=4076 RepID=A0ABS8SYW0_DATST|nr:hypothetical protein [Datura stramonium]